jgi:hypothetical protein
MLLVLGLYNSSHSWLEERASPIQQISLIIIFSAALTLGNKQKQKAQ